MDQIGHADHRSPTLGRIQMRTVGVSTSLFSERVQSRPNFTLGARSHGIQLEDESASREVSVPHP